MSYCPVCREDHDTTACPNPSVMTYYCGCQERKPYCCPVCNGYGTVPEKNPLGLDLGAKTCPACDGACIVWG